MSDEGGVIIRIFRGSLPAERRTEFLDWARSTSVPRVRASAGFRDSDGRDTGVR